MSVPSILILEDEPLIALDLEYTLQQAGFTNITLLASCKAGHEFVSKFTPSVAVLDFQLRDGTCVDLSRLLADRNVPVIVCSGSEERDIEAFNHVAWLAKPCLQIDVLNAVQRALANSEGGTVGRIQNRSEYRFLVDLQADLRSGAYQPSPARRKLIPRAGKPGQFRPLGIPTIRDRVVQGAVKILLEPIFEAQFWHVSDGRNTHGALEYIRRAALPQKRDKDTRRNRLPYPWVIEGDIKGCFDNINHHQLLERFRQRIGDRRVVRLVGSFLKAGVLTEDQFLRTDAGTPQGGIISPLLANIALSAIEERYERWTYHRRKTQARRKSNGVAAAASARDSDRIAGRCVFLPVRYADDFVVLVSGSL